MLFLFPKCKYILLSNNVSPNLTTTWHINRNGTGASPANFTSGRYFCYPGKSFLATTANWTISGTNSKLLIETGATLRGNNKITVPSFQIDGTGTYIHNVNNNAFPEPLPGLLQRQAQLN